MKAIDFAVSRVLPPDLRQDSYDLSKKGLAQLMAQVAAKHPDKFAEITQRLGDLGRRYVWRAGYTSGPEDGLPVIDTKGLLDKMDAEIADLKRQKLPPDEYEEARNEIYLQYSNIIEKETMRKALTSSNAFAKAVASGARGNPAHIKAIVSTPGLYTDAKGRVVPLFVRGSFAQGLRPAELLAGTYGARSAVVSTKKATAKGGDFGKLLTQNTSNFNVTVKDCGTDNGIDLPSDDSSLIGRVLAAPAAGLPPGTVLDRQTIAAIRKTGKPVIVRSAMTCRAKHGLCSRCVGVQADGKFPQIGDSVGITAGQAISEPIVQGALNVKHCLAEGTLVRMADFSLRRIESVNVGEWVLGADVSGNTFPVEVLAVVDQGLQDVQRYTYRMGQSDERIDVICTDDHPILQTTYYTGCAEEAMNYTPRKLPAGRKSGRPSAVLPKSTADVGIREPLATLAGYFMGDGNRWSSAGPTQAVTVSCACRDTIEDLQKVAALGGMILKKNKRSHDWRVVNEGKDKKARRNSLKQLIKRMRMDNLYCHEKSLPDEVWEWDAESVADLIAGFIAADGSVYRSGSTVGVSFSSTSRAMLVGLRDLLRVRCCVYACSVTKTAAAGSKHYRHDMWAFTVTRRDQVMRLSELLAHRTPGKKGRLLVEYLRDASRSHYEKQPFFKAKREKVENVGVVQCWDLSVNHPDELFVLHNSLIVKNTSGMAKGRKDFSGFDYVSQFVQVPDEFKDRAAVAETDGTVERVEDAPQGGKIIVIGGKQHLALPGFDVLVKPGDKVEAGDIISDGLASPADIVRLRGLGEGRKYYLERLSRILTDSGQPPDRRNMEILARATVDNYVVEDPDEDDPWLPDDEVRENDLLAHYRPPPDTFSTAPKHATNAWLQKPVLHYTIGTRITPRIASHLETTGVKAVDVSKSAPKVRPEMPRLRVAAHSSRDWLQSMNTSYLSSQMQQALERGDETNVRDNYHFAPRLAYGADAGAGAFGERISQTGKF